MSAINTLARHFPAAVRDRGKRYFRDGLVTSLRVKDGRVTARVHGSETYQVEVNLDADGDLQSADCTCPYASEHLNQCKHIWATLLTAERQGLLRPGAAGGPSGNGEPSGGEDDGMEDESQVDADAERDEEEDDDEEAEEVALESQAERAIARLPQSLADQLTRLRSKPAADDGGRKPTAIDPVWKQSLTRLRYRMAQHHRHAAAASDPNWPTDRRLNYVLDVAATLNDNRGLAVELTTQRMKNGRWEKHRRFNLTFTQWTAHPDPVDRQIAQMLIGARGEGYTYYADANGGWKFYLQPSAYETTLRLMCQTGRCRLRRPADGVRGRAVFEEIDPEPLTWDDGPPWEFWMAVRPSAGLRNYQVEGELRRGEERMALTEPAVVLRGGLMVRRGAISRLAGGGAFELLAEFRDKGPIPVRREEATDFLADLYAMPDLPPVELPGDMEVQQASPKPRPRLRVGVPGGHPGPHDGGGAVAPADRLVAQPEFDYDGRVIRAEEAGTAFFDRDTRRAILRDRPTEQRLLERLHRAGFRNEWDAWSSGTRLVIPRNQFTRAVHALVADGWQVEADGKLYRRPGEIRVQVSSGIDWFDLSAQVDFGGATASLPQLLAALRRGEKAVTLDDGSLGLLPEEWLKKYAPLAGMGEENDQSVRFTRAQVGFLDALLATEPAVTADETFSQARQALSEFGGIAPVDPPAEFRGELRPYQREGLGWLQFLQKFSFGGCLADDMGLGKTIQVLALLEQRRQAKAGPSLAVVPRSLIFNWIQEAAKFTPELRILDHTGVARRKGTEHFADFDLVLTTYGTLRRDAAVFKDFTFDYAILDEAQAIKNANTDAAKAARLLRARHRLALSGTPVENHIGELWSIFEYLNPGMLGAASAFKGITYGDGNGDAEARALLSRVLRPFILRRTKQQVARDLPEKLEQTLYCELEPAQRKLYDELRDHYRRSLAEKIAEVGLQKSKIMVLEALLRLRQAACHPGLVDKTQDTAGSAKLDTLRAQVAEAIDEGHKVLVFSQFTSLLAILRRQLHADGIVHEYLDGKTRDRQARVDRFQSDPDCKLFLISLKAGGVGLNLTAADYVFLLDPWWNPAVEAQAIDRAHRIGQARSVFAYRLIAKDTVEEKVLELQGKKRDLADAIVNADNSLIAKISREDLELLLS